MAREKDEGKRSAILLAAKRLFAERGFHETSVSDLARETGLPVGSIYTYFENKEAVVQTVIEEGWEDFFEDLSGAMKSDRSPEDKIALVLYGFLPGLFRDVDLISLILSDLQRWAGFPDKLERLALLISSLVGELSEKRGVSFNFPPRLAVPALTIYFLGSLDSVRLSKSAGLGIRHEDILDFIRFTVENAFGVRIDPAAASGIRSQP
jgi:AcrR family transcriptional regulator